MLRKDLIVRQFEAFGKALALLMGRRNTGDWESFEKELLETTQKYSGQTLLEIEAMSDDAWQFWIQSNEDDRNKIVAALLYERLQQHDYHGMTKEANAIGKRCLYLYEKIQNDMVSDEFNLDVYYKLKALKQRQFN